MTITVRTSLRDLDPLDWRRGHPIRGGETTADQPYGVVGIVDQVVHAYAHRLHCLGQLPPKLAQTQWDDDVSGSWIPCGTLPVEVGQHIASLKLIADVEEARVQILTGSMGSAASTRVSGRGTASITLPLTSVDGELDEVTIRYDSDGMTTAYLYSWSLYEVQMIASDMPGVVWEPELLGW